MKKILFLMGTMGALMTSCGAGKEQKARTKAMEQDVEEQLVELTTDTTKTKDYTFYKRGDATTDPAKMIQNLGAFNYALQKSKADFSSDDFERKEKIFSNAIPSTAKLIVRKNKDDECSEITITNVKDSLTGKQEPVINYVPKKVQLTR